MQRLAFTCLCLALTGCGYSTWSDLPFTTGSNPHMPAGDSENMRRVIGGETESSPLLPQAGNIWPGPLPPPPTLQDLEQQGTPGGKEQPVPGSPQFEQGQPPPSLPPPPPARGSSTPSVSSQPSVTPARPPQAPATSSTVPPPAQAPAGQIYQTPQGAGVTTGGGTGYQTITTPGGGSAIVVPNGNGTSTIIHSDGKIETVPTPR